MNRFTKRGSLSNIKRLGFVPKTIIDVGAQTGTPELYEVFPNVKHVLVEPISENEPALQRVISGLPDAEYIIAGATQVDTTIEFKVTPDTRYAYLTKTGSKAPQGWEIRSVRGLKVDSICNQKKLEPPFLIKIDVDGSEIDVLKGCKETLKQTEYIIIEATTNNGQRIFDIINHMREEGFHVYDIVDFLYRPEINDLWQVDIAFVKMANSAIPYKTENGFKIDNVVVDNIGNSTDLLKSPAKAIYGILNINKDKFYGEDIEYKVDTNVTIGGWAIDWINEYKASGVQIVSKDFCIDTEYGLESKFLEKSFGTEKYNHTRFVGNIPYSKLQKGNNYITIRILDKGQNYFYESKPFILTK